MKKVKGFSIHIGKERISIGIVAVEKGCGATHLAIALANYLHSIQGRKSAVIELSGEQALENMVLRDGDGQRELLGVRYFTPKSIGELPELFSMDREAFVMDLGTDYETVRSEFLRCDYKIVVGSLSPWHISRYALFLNKMQWKARDKKIIYLCLFGDIHDIRNFEKTHDVKMKCIPWIENPFYLKKEDVNFLRKIYR